MMQPVPARSGQVISQRYILYDLIGAGGMGAVYRALDRLTNRIVALKRVTVPGEQLQFVNSKASIDFRRSLAEEFKTLATLRHPNVISVLDYGFDQARQPYFTMELLENAQTIIAAAHTRPPAEKIALLIQMMQAMAYLHRRGIIHRDVKPDNVLVTGDTVRVLDFGLAVARQYAGGPNVGVAGTLAYLAPEVLQGAPATEASDLYASGIIAYEIFAGQHPFDVQDVMALINATINLMPDLDHLDLDERLKTMLRRILAKAPGERYPNAGVLLAVYAGSEARYETVSIRESFLQAARFVGREAELAKLTNALMQAGQGQGSAWLVGGEAGVGKTRLLEELRTLALVDGALVLRGQAVIEGGMPYHAWRDVLRRLVIQTPLNDDEAATLKLLIPDIATLLDRPVPDAPDVDFAAAQARLLQVVEAMFRRQPQQTLVLLLEDLQWVVEGMVLLRQLVRIAPELPLLIIGSYRNDEAPNLPDDLPGMRAVSLERLTEREIADLTASMLGDEVGRQQAVIELLHRETEGNVFFIVEVVRALAEDAGQLAMIGNMTLPPSVFAGGIQRVVERRLQRVPDYAMPLLKLAAVAGRELDMNIVPTLVGQIEFDDWLYTCETAMILEIREGRWRFAHDKLREGILNALVPDEQTQVYRTMAEAYERRYGKDPHYAVTLARLWRGADHPAKEYQASLSAGQQAMLNHTYSAARDLFQRAYYLVDAFLPETRATAEYGSLLLGLGHALLATGQLLRAQAEFTACVALGQALPDAALHGRGLIGRGDTALAGGQYDAAQGDYLDALVIAEAQQHPALRLAALRGTATYRLVRGSYAAARQWWEEVQALATNAQDDAALIQSRIGIAQSLCLLGEPEPAQMLLLQAQEQARQMGHRALEQAALRALGALAIQTQRFDDAAAAAATILSMSHDMGDVAGTGWGLLLLADAERGRSSHNAALELYRQALELALFTLLLPLAVAAIVGAALTQAALGQDNEALLWANTALHHPAAAAAAQQQAAALLTQLSSGALAPDRTTTLEAIQSALSNPL